MVLWWNGDPRQNEQLFRDLADECSRLILDLPDPETDVEALRLGLDPSICPFSRDVSWFGLARWRELVAQFFDAGCSGDALVRIESVQITAAAPADRADRTPRIAIWLAAWLAGQLGWEPQGSPNRDAADDEVGLQAAFRGPQGNVAVRIATRPDHSGTIREPRVIEVSVTARGADGRGSERFHLVRPTVDSTAVQVHAESAELCRLPRLVEAPELDPAHRIAAALESSRNDPPFHNALPIALWLMGGDA